MLFWPGYFSLKIELTLEAGTISLVLLSRLILYNKEPSATYVYKRWSYLNISSLVDFGFFICPIIWRNNFFCFLPYRQWPKVSIGFARELWTNSSMSNYSVERSSAVSHNYRRTGRKIAFIFVFPTRNSKPTNTTPTTTTTPTTAAPV